MHGLEAVGFVVMPEGVMVSWLLLWMVLYLSLALPLLWGLRHMTRATARRNAGRVVCRTGGHAAASAPGTPWAVILG